MKVLALAGYDSFFNAARLIAPYFEKLGATVDYALVKARRRKQISHEQLNELGLGNKVQYVDIKDYCESGEILKFDIVLSCLEGLSTRRLFHYLSSYGERRPYVICVYPGLILRYDYDGFAARAPADQLWLNCQRDLDNYTKMCEAYEVDASNSRLFGNVSLLEKIERTPNASDTGPIVFFEQAIIPRYYVERKYLVDKLCDLASRHPRRRFLVKARAAGSKATLHRSWYPIEDLFDEKIRLEGSIPSNISLTEQSAGQLLAEAAHCITVSSTVAIEAIHANVPTTIVRDFGAHDDYGLQYFYGSGLLKSLSEIQIGKHLKVDENWLSKYTCSPYSNLSLIDSVKKDYKRKRDIQSSLRCQIGQELQEEISSYGQEYILSRKYMSKENWLSRLMRNLKKI